MDPFAPFREATAALGRLNHSFRRVRRLYPSHVGLRYESLSLSTHDGLTLAGWWVPGRPGGPAAGATVVLHHHFGGQKATTLPWLELLCELGLDVLAFDARGHGESSVPRLHMVDFVSRAYDVEAAADEARRRKDQPVIALGQSQGGAAVVIAAARSDRIAAVVADSGPAPELWTASWGLAGAALGPKGSASTRAGMALFFTATGRPVRYAARLWPSLWALRNRPLLWLHGTADEVIPRARSGLWFGAVSPSAPRWRPLCVEGGRHVALVQAAPQAIREELLRLRAQLGQTSPAGSMEGPGAAAAR